MSEETLERLEEIAEAVSTNERKVSPMQVAAQLLEDGVEGIEEDEVALKAWRMDGIKTRQKNRIPMAGPARAKRSHWAISARSSRARLVA